MGDDERRRIARDLHDSAGQLLAGANMNLEITLQEKSLLSPKASAALDECSDLIQQTLKEIRIVSYLLHPPLLDESGLQSALEWILEAQRHCASRNRP